ncbi:MAG: antitoxin VapB family protein [Nanoarchaeota archaeon]
MAKTIMVSNEAYEKLKSIKEKEDRSFSEVIIELVNDKKTKRMGDLKEVYGLLEGDIEYDKEWKETLRKGWGNWSKKYA